MEDIAITLPKNLENMALPEPELVDYYRDLDERTIWISEDIDDYTLHIAKKIIYFNRLDAKKPIEKRKPIKLIFFSFGGSLDVHNTLIDTIQLSKTPIWGINAGRCMSAAAFMFLACHKRFCMPRATFLFHQGSGGFSGNFSEVISQIENYQEDVENLSNFMKKYTKYTDEEIDEKIPTEWYIRSDEALEKGVCDEIVNDINILL